MATDYDAPRKTDEDSEDSIEELERNLDRAMSDARRVRDRDYPDRRDDPDEHEYPRR